MSEPQVPWRGVVLGAAGWVPIGNLCSGAGGFTDTVLEPQQHPLRTPRECGMLLLSHLLPNSASK